MTKKIQGINIPIRYIRQPSPVIRYCTCLNCGQKWEEQFTAYIVTSQMTQAQFDYCTECYKEDKNK